MEVTVEVLVTHVVTVITVWTPWFLSEVWCHGPSYLFCCMAFGVQYCNNIQTQKRRCFGPTVEWWLPWPKNDHRQDWLIIRFQSLGINPIHTGKVVTDVWGYPLAFVAHAVWRRPRTSLNMHSAMKMGINDDPNSCCMASKMDPLKSTCTAWY